MPAKRALRATRVGPRGCKLAIDTPGRSPQNPRMLRAAPIALITLSFCTACGGMSPQDKKQIATLEQQLGVLSEAYESQESRLNRLREQLELLQDQLEARQIHQTREALPVVKLRPASPPAGAPAPVAPEPAVAADTRPPVTITQADLDALSPAAVAAEVSARRLPGRPVPPPENAGMADNLGVVPIASRAKPALVKRSALQKPVAADPAVSAYKQAYALYRSGAFSQAEPALQAFIRDHARHDYADNAMFWIGQMQFDQSRFAAALATFRKVVATWPAGNKVPDALLMIGLTQAKLGQVAEGRETLARLRAMYPQTEAARKADARLNDRAGSM